MFAHSYMLSSIASYCSHSVSSIAIYCLHTVKCFQVLLFNMETVNDNPNAKTQINDTNPENYRSVALTNYVYKTTEWIINSRVTWYLEDNKIPMWFLNKQKLNRPLDLIWNYHKRSQHQNGKFNSNILWHRKDVWHHMKIWNTERSP